MTDANTDRPALSPPAEGVCGVEAKAAATTDRMIEKAKAVRALLDRLNVANTRHLTDGALSVEYDRLLAAAQPEGK